MDVEYAGRPVRQTQRGRSGDPVPARSEGWHGARCGLFALGEDRRESKPSSRRRPGSTGDAFEQAHQDAIVLRGSPSSRPRAGTRNPVAEGRDGFLPGDGPASRERPPLGESRCHPHACWSPSSTRRASRAAAAFRRQRRRPQLVFDTTFGFSASTGSRQPHCGLAIHPRPPQGDGMAGREKGRAGMAHQLGPSNASGASPNRTPAGVSKASSTAAPRPEAA